ncbi:MAG: universal stress protein UspA [Blastopirellula sp.]|nr:MAG: universal stress protein UspA [Blastopirellula sp.]
MNFKKILFPTDFSHCGDAALQMATVLAKESGATLIIAHVEEPPSAYAGGEMYYGMLDPSIEQLQKLLHEIKPTDESVSCQYELVTGDPAQAIIRMATDEKVDLIVMGTHGRTGFLHLLIGSTAEAIVRRAPCPVLTYKEPHEVAVAD